MYWKQKNNDVLLLWKRCFSYDQVDTPCSQCVLTVKSTRKIIQEKHPMILSFRRRRRSGTRCRKGTVNRNWRHLLETYHQTGKSIKSPSTRSHLVIVRWFSSGNALLNLEDSDAISPEQAHARDGIVLTKPFIKPQCQDSSARNGWRIDIICKYHTANGYICQRTET